MRAFTGLDFTTFAVTNLADPPQTWGDRLCRNRKFVLLIVLAGMLAWLYVFVFAVWFLLVKLAISKASPLRSLRTTHNLFVLRAATITVIIRWVGMRFIWFSVVLIAILILSGDIHPHPGPNKLTADITVLSANWCSIRSAHKRILLEASLESLGKPDIVCIQESWLGPDIENSELPLDGYAVFRHDREQRTGGGVLTAVKHHMKVQRLNNLHRQPTEMVWLEISGFSRGEKILLGNYYRPYAADVMSAAAIVDSLDLASAHAARTGAKIVIVGDFNTPDIRRWGDYAERLRHQGSHTIREGLCDSNLTQLVNRPTRGENILDLVCTSHPGFIKNLEHVPLFSDHEGLLFRVASRASLQRAQPTTAFKWSRANFEAIREQLSNFCEEYLHTARERSVESNWKAIRDKLIALAREHVPQGVTKRRAKPLPREVIRLVRRRDRAFKAWKMYPTPENRLRYTQLRNRAQRECRKAHRARMDELADSLRTGSRTFFQHVKSLRNERVGVPDLTIDGNNVSEPMQKATALNTQFCRVFTAELPYEYLPDADLSGQNMDMIRVTQDGLKKRLEGLDVKKASGPDNIPAILLKAVAEPLSGPLSLLFQQSLDTGDVPKDWRVATIHPVFKKGDKSSPGNYRPISLTSVVCKQLEHVVVSQIHKFCAEHRLLYDRQHGFRSGRSCDTALASLIHDWASILDSGRSSIDCVLLDFSKAFDTVPHRRLIHKVKALGVHPKICRWIRNFLSGRLQRVNVAGSTSSWLPVTSGVPQGSVIGPLLFSIYINDIHRDITPGTVMNLFADDALLYRAVTTTGDCAIVQHDLDTLSRWSGTWMLKFNVSKCAHLRISTKRRETVATPDYNLCGEVLPKSVSERYLGIQLTADFKFNAHIELLNSKCRALIGFLKRNLSACSRRAKRIAYIALVRSRLEFCAAVLDPTAITMRAKLEAIQSKAVRFICNNYERLASVSAMKRDVNLPLLEDRRTKLRHDFFLKVVKGRTVVPGLNLHVENGLYRVDPPVSSRRANDTIIYRTVSEVNAALITRRAGTAPALVNPP